MDHIQAQYGINTDLQPMKEGHSMITATRTETIEVGEIQVQVSVFYTPYEVTATAQYGSVVHTAKGRQYSLGMTDALVKSLLADPRVTDQALYNRLYWDHILYGSK